MKTRINKKWKTVSVEIAVKQHNDDTHPLVHVYNNTHSHYEVKQRAMKPATFIITLLLNDFIFNSKLFIEIENWL